MARRFQRRPSQPGRKALQLCAQVADTLTLVLAGSPDDLLRDLTVQSVQPAPDASRMLVTLMLSTVSPASPVEALERLARAAGELRTEVAAAITRRKAPELIYTVTRG